MASLLVSFLASQPDNSVALKQCPIVCNNLISADGIFSTVLPCLAQTRVVAGAWPVHHYFALRRHVVCRRQPFVGCRRLTSDRIDFGNNASVWAIISGSSINVTNKCLSRTKLSYVHRCHHVSLRVVTNIRNNASTTWLDTNNCLIYYQVSRAVKHVVLTRHLQPLTTFYSCTTIRQTDIIT